MKTYISILMLFLFGCAAHSTGQEQRMTKAFMDFQAICMASEMDESYSRSCIKAKYHLCREAAKYERRVWVSAPRVQMYDRSGYPRHIQEMRSEMGLNGCYPRLP